MMSLLGWQSVQWARHASFCMEQVLDMLTISHVACQVIASRLPQRKAVWVEWHSSSPSNRGIGRWRKVPSVQAGRPRQRMAKDGQPFACSAGGMVEWRCSTIITCHDSLRPRVFATDIDWGLAGPWPYAEPTMPLVSRSVADLSLSCLVQRGAGRHEARLHLAM